MIYGIFSNTEIKEFDTHENAIEMGADYTCQSELKYTDEYKFNFFDLSFFDKFGERLILTFNTWKLAIPVITIRLRKGEICNQVKITDKLGQIESTNIFASSIVLFLKKFATEFEIISKFNTWKEYRLFSENERHIIEIEKLKSEMKNF